jgi:hypothetical protein
MSSLLEALEIIKVQQSTAVIKAVADLLIFIVCSRVIAKYPSVKIIIKIVIMQALH